MKVIDKRTNLKIIDNLKEIVKEHCIGFDNCLDDHTCYTLSIKENTLAMIKFEQLGYIPEIQCAGLGYITYMLPD